MSKSNAPAQQAKTSDKAPAAPATTNSAAPGIEAPKAKKEKKPKVKRIEYVPPTDAPFVKDGKLTALPTDFDAKKYKPLRAKQFADEGLYFDLKAAHYEDLAKKARADAETARKTGNLKDKVKAKKLLAMQKRMAELSASLAGEGVDVAALLASVEAEVTTETKADAKAPEAAAAAK